MTGTLTLPAPSALRFRSAAAVTSAPRRRPMRTLAFAAATAPAASRSLYEVLRVEETASPAEIKAAYRSLAKRFHPDASASAAAASSLAAASSGHEFIEIHRAYATLSDPSARGRYDLSIGRLRFAGGAWPRTRRWETDQCW